MYYHKLLLGRGIGSEGSGRGARNNYRDVIILLLWRMIKFIGEELLVILVS